MKPLPMLIGEQRKFPAASASKPIAVPTVSTMESTAPTSWNSTSSGDTLWTLPSDIASFVKISTANRFAPAVRLLSESLRSRSEIAVANHRQNFRCLAMKVTVPAVVMLMSVILAGAFHQDVEFHCAKIRAHHARRPQFIPFDRQFLELRLQVIEIEAQIQQRADRHIAADAGEAVEI